MITITANIPARSVKSATGKVFSYAARVAVFTQNELGQWWSETYSEFVRESDVIETCSKASNWADIRQVNFPMHGFHS